MYSFFTLRENKLHFLSRHYIEVDELLYQYCSAAINALVFLPHL